MYSSSRSYKNSASFSASWGTKWGTIFVRPKSVRPNVRPNDRTYDRTTKSVRPNDQKRTTERPQYVGPNGHVNVRTYDQLKTHIERFLFGKTCCERFFSNFWLDIQWRNSHSQQQFVLNVGYPISSQKHVSGTSTLWSVSLRPKLTLISLIQTTKKNSKKHNQSAGLVAKYLFLFVFSRFWSDSDEFGLTLINPVHTSWLLLVWVSCPPN